MHQDSRAYTGARVMIRREQIWQVVGRQGQGAALPKRRSCQGTDLKRGPCLIPGVVPVVGVCRCHAEQSEDQRPKQKGRVRVAAKWQPIGPADRLGGEGVEPGVSREYYKIRGISQVFALKDRIR